MKTNVIMSRKMGSFEVSQRTKDGMFNATYLLKQWNNASGSQKAISHFTENKATKEFIKELENQPEIKERNSVLLQTKGRTGATWMHPYLFIDFAMWLNPAFKVQVIRFVYDQLIQFRHKAGDNYRSLSGSVRGLNDPFSPNNVNYSKLSKALNYIVFNRHEAGIRNSASEQELKELSELEQKLSFALDMGYIKSFDLLLEEMRRIYHHKWNKKVA